MPPTPVAAPWYGSTADGMVVRFDLERDGQTVADRDDSGVLARAGDHARTARRERPQQRPRALVGAVLAPHHAEHRQLEVVRHTAVQAVADRLELLVGQPEPTVERLDVGHRRPRLGEGHRVPASSSGRPPVEARAALSTSERMIGSPASEPRIDFRGTLGVRHQPTDVAGRVEDPGDRPQAAVRVRDAIVLGGRATVGVDVPEQDLPLGLERVERRVIRVVAPLAVGDRHAQRLRRRTRARA